MTMSRGSLYTVQWNFGYYNSMDWLLALAIAKRSRDTKQREDVWTLIGVGHEEPSSKWRESQSCLTWFRDPLRMIQWWSLRTYVWVGQTEVTSRVSVNWLQAENHIELVTPFESPLSPCLLLLLFLSLLALPILGSNHHLNIFSLTHTSCGGSRIVLNPMRSTPLQDS